MNAKEFLARLDVRDLAEVAEGIRAKHGCTIEELHRSRRAHAMRARREMAGKLREELGWSLRAIAELFGCDASTVSNLLQPKRKRAA